MLMALNCPMSFGQSNISSKWGRFNLLSVDTTWQYKSGKATPAFFSPSFNDENWQTVSNTYFDQISPASPNWNGIGIFRKNFSVPDSLKGRNVELFLTQVGASEIYLDGQMLCHYGNVTGKMDDQIIVQKSVLFKLDSAAAHVLAIYYSNRIKHSLVDRYGLSGFGINLSAVTPVNSDDDYYFYHMIISLGIILSFCLFFWCIYAFYPSRLASLITALQLTNFSLIFAGGMLRDYTNTDLKQFLLGQTFWEIGFSCTFGWALVLVHTLYYKKLTWRTWVVGSLMFITLLLVLFQSNWWYNIARTLIVVYLIETWRVLILGLRQKRTGFWILAIGFFLNIAGTVFIILDLFHVFPWHITSTQNILGVVTDLSFPLTVALHLAWEFGSANRDLRKQLVHVKELSKKTLEQEQEKQQLLSTQNEMLDQQVTQRTAELSHSLNELRSTQAQLIQSEKMASLGELTAGIAHEIQNPLNFVNNFSEVNDELIEEMNGEEDINEIKAIASDIKQNNDKIALHGKRADAIVKGMLQHSRTTSGQKELTDINKLADEYFRLSYHGIRAKDKSFNAEIQTDFDGSIGKINVVPQDIGRVMLNLINNAFYAVNEKAASCKRQAVSYEPRVSVKTKRVAEKTLISVTDNGNGIPKNIVDKIFQPFFTTKPTGQGTGLGLSLAYDIAKAHGGEIKVQTKEGEGSEFIVQLPIQ